MLGVWPCPCAAAPPAGGAEPVPLLLLLGCPRVFGDGPLEYTGYGGVGGLGGLLPAGTGRLVRVLAAPHLLFYEEPPVLFLLLGHGFPQLDDGTGAHLNGPSKRCVLVFETCKQVIITGIL